MKKLYEKPMFKRVYGISFVLATLRASVRRACRQCCSCHGCR